jgi:hypothetical protein
MSATEQGRAQAAVPVLEAALAAAKNSHDRDVIQMGLGVTMVRNCLVEGRVGPARRYAGVTLRDIERHLR